jgi:hypothetical protein
LQLVATNSLPCSIAVVLQAEERQALQRKQDAFMTEVEEWSQGEVEAVKAAAAARVQQAEQSAAQW